MNVLVVAPMQREARAAGATAVGAGMHAGARLRRLLEERPCQAVLIAGTCGALDPSLRPGDIIVSRSVVAHDRPELPGDARMLGAARSALGGERNRRVTFISSRLLTVAAPVIDLDSRRDLWNTFGAGGVDMETYALADEAVARGVPWLAVRAVSDGSAARMPSPVARWRDESDDPDVMRAIARRPWCWPSAARLALGTRAALRSLALTVPVIAGALERVDFRSVGPAGVDGQRRSPDTLVGPAAVDLDLRVR